MKIKNLNIKNLMYEMDEEIMYRFRIGKIKLKRILSSDLITEYWDEDLILKPNSDLIKMEIDNDTFITREYVPNFDKSEKEPDFHRNWMIVYDENGQPFNSKKTAIHAVEKIKELGHTAVVTKGTYYYNKDDGSVDFDEGAYGVSVECLRLENSKLVTKKGKVKSKVYAKKNTNVRRT